MALSPEECLKLTPDEVELVSKMEENIDHQLRCKFENENSMPQILCQVVGFKVMDRIISLYRAAGWEVEVVANTSDVGGKTLSFKKKSQRSYSGGYQDR